MAIEKRIYTVADAHLDTVWNWDFEYTIGTCIYNTLADNFALFEKYPDYKFNFEGSYRYELMEEYYPELFEQLKKYVEQGRWNVAGSCYENGDVNVPSPELLFRNILYGNSYFARTFGKTSKDIFLPDCFGFGWALPSIAEHGNLKGFTTQKLEWGSAYGIPFDIGRWVGVNGKSIYASLDSKNYTANLKKVRHHKPFEEKLKNNEKKYGLPWTFGFHGTGDQGGSPKDESVQTVCTEISQNDKEKVQVLSAESDRIFKDLDELTPEQKAKLPVWENELVMTNHGVGAYTSRAFGKRCNRRNEELADLAERSCVAAEYLVGAPYPKVELEKAWKRNIAHTFHDDITGTSLQRVYKRSWNDYIASSNQFANAYEGAAGEIVKQLDTSWILGVPVVVNNHFEFERKAAVNATIASLGSPHIRVFDAYGDEVPAQVVYADEKVMQITFIADVPAMGYKVYDVRPSETRCVIDAGLRANGDCVENFKYIVRIDKNGDICSIVDKTLANKELLKKPIRYCLYNYKGDETYPAWEMKYKQAKHSAADHADMGEIEIIEKGPARITVKVKQLTDKSIFTYFLCLSSVSEYIEVYNEIEWRDMRKLLKNQFCLTAENDKATFDLGLGAIKRGKMNKKLYEVPAQKWADISDAKQAFGVSILSDSKYGWDKKDANTLRLTVLHTPQYNFREESMQSMMDLGLNRYGYAIYSHYGTWENGTQNAARSFNQPMCVFVTDAHEGTLGAEYSFGCISNPNVIVRALKKSEFTDEYVVRVNEGVNRRAESVRLLLGDGVESARELFASEEHRGSATVENGRLVFELDPYEVKTFAVKLYDCRVGSPAAQKAIELPYNVDVVTFNNNRPATVIPTLGYSIPGEIYPLNITCGGIDFKTAELGERMNNALICDGQTIAVNGTKLYFIAASLAGDRKYTFNVGTKPVELGIQAVNERIACWDLYDLGETAFIKTDKLAWECTHTHAPDKDNIAQQLFFFRYELDIKDAVTVTLPVGNAVMILAATQTDDAKDAAVVTELYDKVDKREFDFDVYGKDEKIYKQELKKVTDKKKK